MSSVLSPHHLKKNIRKHLREKRQGLSEQEQVTAGLAVLQQLKKHHVYQSAQRTAVYLANDGELPLFELANDILRRRKKCFLPMIFNYRHQKLHFAAYQKKTTFVRNRYNILEPNISIKKRVKPADLDLLLMPLVAFDVSGNRLGMGGGYYDRSLAFLKRRKHWKKPRLVGVAHDFQEVANLPSDYWDIPLDVIVTPTRLIKFNALV